MSAAAQYVVAAYAVVLVALVMYVIVVAMRTARLGRQAELLTRLVEREGATSGDERGRQAEPKGSRSPEEAGV